jgi:hypothetical protein
MVKADSENVFKRRQKERRGQRLIGLAAIADHTGIEPEDLVMLIEQHGFPAEKDRGLWSTTVGKFEDWALREVGWFHDWNGRRELVGLRAIARDYSYPEGILEQIQHRGFPARRNEAGQWVTTFGELSDWIVRTNQETFLLKRMHRLGEKPAGRPSAEEEG